MVVRIFHNLNVLLWNYIKMKINIISGQKGFTLIELMVAIVLGLIITAAAIQLFITGQASVNLQRGMADLQDSGNFGLRYISNDIRKANYGNVNIVNDRLANGGIVLTSRFTPSRPTSATTFTDANISVNMNIKSGATPPVAVQVPLTTFATGSSNVKINTTDQGSDQLVVQFYADQAGIDCEGNAYTANRYIVERFFLRTDSNSASNEPNAALALACEAGSYVGDTATNILKNPISSTTVFGTTGGEILIRRVDHLHFLLGISNDNNSGDLRYIPINTYLALNQNPRPRVNAVQIGMLIRSSESVKERTLISDSQTFNVLDQTVNVKVPTGTPPKYLRRVVTQTIALRNALISTDAAVM